MTLFVVQNRKVRVKTRNHSKPEHEVEVVEGDEVDHAKRREQKAHARAHDERKKTQTARTATKTATEKKTTSHNHTATRVTMREKTNVNERNENLDDQKAKRKGKT